ncbi:response regulator transcription factor [Chryseobacterium sp. Tr-659]|uniref:response regulator transcription factor n=1 Tax=Chryseobacterium sp. Tr-659 TaxID=2608340 RepID=UPI00141DF334|nr:response regulator transcription factor [Chryseobacterium sp. Tr-659]NIF04720.1 response regulator transcription factor [Chryseobacterium sp. Tr-659]
MNKPQILYLEDDPDLGEVTTDLLSRKGFTVKWVNDGAEGLEAIANHEFDLILADIMMPKLDGYTFLKQIREKGNPIPFILLSARVLTEDVLHGFSIGADDYMRKPFNLEELTARINRLLKKPSAVSIQTEKKIITVGIYEYNPTTYKLSNKGESVSLSPRSGEVLYRLATNKDNFLPRKETLLELWGDDNFFNGRSLDVFISKLRKTLSEDSRISIINIRATGYRLIID